jgi:threonine dehydrogenase-like Zn-dependent dehydrogenase
VPVPEFSPWEVLLKVKAVGICGSDLRMFKYADANRRGNYILGHELSGEVVELGEKVHGFKKGDRVAAEICIGCAICRYCRKGLVNLCENLNEIGAKHTFNIRNADPVEEILQITDGGVDYTFEATGDPSALQQAIYMTRKNGSIVVMTVHKEIQIDIEPVIRNELKLFGSICYNYKEFDQAVDLLAKNRIDVNPLIGHTFSLKEADKAFDFCFSRKGVKIILEP